MGTDDAKNLKQLHNREDGNMKYIASSGEKSEKKAFKYPKDITDNLKEKSELNLEAKTIPTSGNNLIKYISNDKKAEWEIDNIKELVEETAFRLDHPKEWAKKARKREPIVYPSFHTKPTLAEYREREVNPPFLELLSLQVPKFLRPPETTIVLGDKPLYILGRGGDNFKDTPRDLPKICPFQKQRVLIRTTWISKTDE